LKILYIKKVKIFLKNDFFKEKIKKYIKTIFIFKLYFLIL